MVSRKRELILRLILISSIVFAQATAVHQSALASTPSTPTYKFDFTNNFSPTLGTATFSSAATTTWGTQGGDSYWQWSGATGSGPGLNLTNYSISDTYTITIKFSVTTLSSYTRILNFNEGDIGLYLLGGHIDYYNYISSSAPIYAANDVITMTLTRNPQFITLYTSDSTTATTTQRFQYAAGSIGRASVLSTLPFFTDDGGEFSPSGKVFGVSIWNDRALSSTEINSFLYTPLVPSLQMASIGASVIYRSATALDLTMNLPGHATYFVNNKRIPNCVNLLNSGSANSYSVRCNWSPSLHGAARLSAVLTPTDSAYSAMNTFATTSVKSRAGLR
jgi:hypothetical protein